MIIHRIRADRQQAEKTLRVAAYCRVSTGKREQEESLETQQSIYASYIQAAPGWTLAGIYADTRSGLCAEKRAGFMQMIHDACDGQINLILCKSISRFSRNIVECQRFVELLRIRNITVVFEKEHIRTDDPTSSWVFSLMCAFAQDESRSISENIRIANRHRVEAGIYTPSRNRMLGYDVMDGKYVPNKDAWIIRMIFQLYADGMRMTDICREVNRAGAHRMRADEPMSYQAIQHILSNETYVGDKQLQKAPPKNYMTKRADPMAGYVTNYLREDHCAIVSREVWDKAQKRRAAEKGKRKASVSMVMPP